MKEQLRWGRMKYISFILLDLFCLISANILAALIYLDFGRLNYGYTDYAVVVAYMIVIDLIVTATFNTLKQVLRRRKRKELTECFKHVGISFVLLALFLFSTKQGAAFSRATIYMAYGFCLILLFVLRIAWKAILNSSKKNVDPTALLITTAGYASEGLRVMEHAKIVPKGLFVTDKTNEGRINDIPVIVDCKSATEFLCWERIDKVYICGPDNIDVPEALLTACQQMDIPVFTASSSKSLDYEIVKIRTALQKDDSSTGLSFFESEHDIPFSVNRMYTFFESEQDNQTGFHTHKQSWHLLFCPYGAIDVAIDTGKEKKTVSLCSPSVGLLLHPSVWRKMDWKQPGSVLCVAASGHYDEDKLRTDYNEYLAFLQEKEWSAVIESAEIMGEVTL